MFIFPTPSSNQEQLEVLFPYDEQFLENRNRQVEKQTAVLELFTSQGCSSCPPADEQLNRVISQANAGLLEVVALSFHVDYWDRLGWKDPFSKVEFSNRQRMYRPKFGGRIYTPQLVINGEYQLVGSQPGPWSELKQALKTPVTNKVFLDDLQKEDGKLSVAYKLEGDFAGWELHVALVLKQHTQQVKAGENRGRTLLGNNIVREFTTLLPDRSGEGRVSFPFSNYQSMDDYGVIAYLQHPVSLEIRGAAEV
ncbi:DUF1223 domain-containing protein [bacterium SCSIO 12741]|nr:DUF1223 domain-containing protein [bacterium SCSIO 12741]